MTKVGILLIKSFYEYNFVVFKVLIKDQSFTKSIVSTSYGQKQVLIVFKLCLRNIINHCMRRKLKTNK